MTLPFEESLNTEPLEKAIHDKGEQLREATVEWEMFWIDDHVGEALTALADEGWRFHTCFERDDAPDGLKVVAWRYE